MFFNLLVNPGNNGRVAHLSRKLPRLASCTLNRLLTGVVRFNCNMFRWVCSNSWYV